ncbi:type II toxin-antitoxin system YoeB family toxin [Streptomyces clavifer]|nr:type II toxin-antitoxin system YoeB family toxin [Streptomyces clavifer]
MGKPDPLKHGFQGFWSGRSPRSAASSARFVEDEVRIAACRYGYGP